MAPSNIGYSLRECGHHFRRNWTTVLGAVVTIFLSLFIIGLFVLGSVMINNMVGSVEDTVTIQAFLADDADQSAVTAFQTKVQGWDNVESVVYKDKDQALEEYRTSMSNRNAADAVAALDGENPLPASLVIKLTDPQQVEDTAQKIIADTDFQSICDDADNPAGDVNYGRQTVERLFSVANYIRIAAVVLVALLTFVAFVFINNTIRLKPKDNVYADGEVLAIVTIVTERYRTQYALLYTTRMQEAVTDKEIECSERNAYNNPAVSLSTADMTKYARQIWSSSAKYRNVATKMHRMVMRLNNIYSVGEYFFIDFSVENKTNIRFDIDEMRIKLSDKKQSKATNAQIVELTPSLVLDDAKTFKYGYRNVIVVKKMTFPNDKVLTIELSEKQISGRTISLSIDYEDVLSADSFNHILLEEE